MKKYEVFHSKTQLQKTLIRRENFTYRIILRVLDQYVKPGQAVLDIGCGVGTLAFYISQTAKKVVGIDISKNAINAAKRDTQTLGLNNTSFYVKQFPFVVPKGKYDLIICTEVIEHLVDDNLAIQKMYHLLKKGGILIISTPSINAPMYKLGLAKEFDIRVGHLRRYSTKKLVELCKKNKLKIIETKQTEGIIRNFLFLNPVAGKAVRYIKFFLVDVVSILDLISLKLFGESQIFIVAQKTL